MATKYEMSKTYQYRKVMKPLLERKRRARINKCLDELKDLMAECLDQGSEAKFEKADILEVTVQHLRKIKAQKQQQQKPATNEHPEQSFRAGYIRAANEVSRCLAALPKVDIVFGTSLMTHLGMRLNQLECAEEQHMAVNAPLSINCTSAASQASTAYSPVSSGYASDSDCSASTRSSPAIYSHKPLLQVSNTSSSTTNSVWRPW